MKIVTFLSLIDFENEIDTFLDLALIESREDLIEEYEAWFDGKGPRDLESLPVRHNEVSGVKPRPVLKPNEFDYLFRLISRRCNACLALTIENTQRYVVDHRELFEGTYELKRPSDTQLRYLTRFQAVDLLARRK